MPCRYRLIAIDLDGTLLGPSGEVSPANLEAIERARRADVQVVIATGRAFVESMEPLESIAHEGAMVAAGGAMWSHVPTGRTVDRSAVPERLARHVGHSLVRHGHKALLLKDSHITGYDYLAVGDGELDPATVWWFDVLPVRVRFVARIEDDPHPHDTVRIGTVARDSDLATICSQLREELGDRVFLQHWPAVTQTEAVQSRTHMLEVFNPRVSKWTMLQSIMRQRDLDPSQVAAIGDEINDITMITNAGLGIAMSNGVEPVLTCADQITESNEDDGVARAIERILAGNW